MASARRTLLVTNHDRPLKGQSLLGRPENASPPFLHGLRCLLGGVHPRKNPWRRSVHRAILFSFFVGFFWGLLSFVDLDDSSDISPPHVFFFDPIRAPPPAEEQERLPDPFDKLLIIVTPTYNRAFQGYHLSRLAHTLKLVPPPLLWIVVETKTATAETADILRRSGVMYRHLVCRKNTSVNLHRDVRQRHTALKHIRLHRLDGIVYMADDDNIYSLDLFDRLRQIRRFATWPVAMLAQSKNKVILQGPVCNGRKVIGWHTNRKGNNHRRFHVDISGFAFNSSILWNPRRWMYPKDIIRLLDTVTERFEDTGFIEQIVEDEGQLEGLPNDCSRIMNWRLQLESRSLVYPRGWQISENLNTVVPLN
ncbi:probable beta-1,4-xylosyltransferase IRX9H isoform X1 [Musa acuminata AAA Group]|uniref:probable beta-1,4-xylosyltransferase IRX9H isoform X1 n=1 Tax=Musa acuminata AAA Group TaxID=214697 RepID=UPI0031E30251